MKEIEGLILLLYILFESIIGSKYRALLDSRNGKIFGWYIELDAEILGELTNCKSEDMFWDSYDIIPINDAAKEKLQNREPWDLCKFKYKNKKNGRYSENAFCPITNEQFDITNRIQMRGLYLV